MSVLACCSTLYGSPIAELLVGDSFHPGGRAGTRELLRTAGLTPGSRLLDIGAGLGTSARLAADEFGLCVDAADVSAQIVDRGRDRAANARVRWTVAALPNLPFAGGQFDAVLAECVLSTTDRPSALSEIRRVLRPGGLLIMSDVEAENADAGTALDALIGSALCITDAWRPGEMGLLLDAAGFVPVRRWDRSSDILALIDRMEARLHLARTAAGDFGVDLTSLLAAAADPRWRDSGPVLAATAATLRDAVPAGRLGYVAQIASAMPPVGP